MFPCSLSFIFLLLLLFLEKVFFYCKTLVISRQEVGGWSVKNPAYCRHSKTLRARVFTSNHVSCVTCHMSCFTFHLSLITCWRESVTCNQVCGVSQWRVCYQWGLPCLVFREGGMFQTGLPIRSKPNVNCLKNGIFTLFKFCFIMLNVGNIYMHILICAPSHLW